MMGSGQSAGRLGGAHPDGLAWAELTVCAAYLGEFPGSDDRLPPTRLVRRGELVNLTGRAAAAEVTLGELVVSSAAVAEEPGRSAGELSEEAVSTVRPRWNAAEADPQPGTDALGHDLPALADLLVHCLFTAGLAVQSAATLADGPVAAQLEQVTDQLDGIICDIRTAVFESQTLGHRYSPQAS